MNQKNIAVIEDTLKVKLPGFYVDLLTNYPPALLGTDAEDFALMSSPEAIITENLSVRESFYGEIWPENFFVVGQNGCGDLYIIKLDAHLLSVSFFDHEKRVFFPYADTKDSLIENLLAEIREIDSSR